MVTGYNGIDNKRRGGYCGRTGSVLDPTSARSVVVGPGGSQGTGHDHMRDWQEPRAPTPVQFVHLSALR